MPCLILFITFHFHPVSNKRNGGERKNCPDGMAAPSVARVLNVAAAPLFLAVFVRVCAAAHENHSYAQSHIFRENRLHILSPFGP